MSADQPILLITSRADFAPLADALRQGGLAVIHAADAEVDYASRASVQAGLSAVLAGTPRPKAILYAAATAETLARTAAHEIGDARWEASVHDPLRDGLFVMQALHALMPKDPPPIFFLGPAMGVTGAVGFTALSAVIEGQRALMKSCARQWGKDGWRLNWIGLGNSACLPKLVDAKAPVLPDMSGPAIGHQPAIADEVGPLIALLSEGAARPLTGASLFVDGGEWMLP